MSERPSAGGNRPVEQKNRTTSDKAGKGGDTARTRHQKKKENKKKWGKAFKVLFWTLLATGILLVAGAAWFVKGIIDDAPAITFLDVQPEGYTTILYDQEGNEIQQLHGEDANRIYVELDQIPVHVQDAFIAIEDERFWSHNGVDVRGIFRAVVRNIQANNLTASGASTLTQQLIKNNVLDSEKRWERKIQEQYLAIQLERQISKELILEYYLNTIHLGKGNNGVQAAANAYFNKEIWELTVAEGAVLAAITQRPAALEPVANPEANRTRQQAVLAKMLELGFIDQATHDQALSEDVHKNIQYVREQIAESSDYSYFVDATIQQLSKDLQEAKGFTETQAFNMIYRGGLRVHITQDLKMQEAMDGILNDDANYPPENEDYAIKVMFSLSVEGKDGTEHKYKEGEFKTREKAESFVEELKAEWTADGGKILAEKVLYVPQPQAAMAVLDYRTGHVKAISGGRGVKVGNQTFNRATQAKRQPGSTFKTLAAYVPAIDARGYTLATVMDDVPFTYQGYSPKNWYSTFKGISTVREGLEQSMNILAVKAMVDVTPDLAFQYLEDMGFSTLVDRKTIDGKVYTDKTMALPLGGLTEGVTVLELTVAYGSIANQGVYVEPILYTKVLNHDGSILLDNQPETRTVMKDSTAFLVTNALQTAVEVGTGREVIFKNTKMPVAGKTGTTTDNIDLIFAGYTPYYAAAIWMGYDQPKRMAYQRGYHKFIWRDVMDKIHEGLPYKEFTMPGSVVQARICTESGLLAVEGLCDADPRGSTVRYEYFAQGTVPTQTCDVHIAVPLCALSNLLATEYCPEEVVGSKVFIQRPARLLSDKWSTEYSGNIADWIYQLPANLEGEYCNIHGPQSREPFEEESREGENGEGTGIVIGREKPGRGRQNETEETDETHRNEEN
ncbi:transglycosylase domain-containing protein [Anaerotalea alkaliphila]|uniref:Penicillin-binding protein 1A n=1 Tax=Anaerotalea alkaliphila TaxID=2662126 RepID=A0A7X5HVH1_9FIRM|nr:PBP1A family penicillin-binding protein [Anaerotalea alkaliphila]NDL67400.1 PBP1A family penicillin-binding protein [Anaerotalea alkaliphila]